MHDLRVDHDTLTGVVTRSDESGNRFVTTAGPFLVGFAIGAFLFWRLLVGGF
ncbi:MAG TPA: hypothetical protein VGP80_07255 [Gemmatimonadales bacterium]|nr:hypothetical protein [Gemmatimonadales bacterium]